MFFLSYNRQAYNNLSDHPSKCQSFQTTNSDMDRIYTM